MVKNVRSMLEVSYAVCAGRSLVFSAQYIHFWNLRRSRKLQKNAHIKTSYIERSRSFNVIDVDTTKSSSLW